MTDAFTPDLLLAHTAWLRRLATSLVRDTHAAEDLTQQAMALALERPPRRATALPGFLTRIVQYLARQRWREQKRRERRERIAARPEKLEDVLDKVATQRDLVDRVLQMSACDRDVILLRFFEEMSPAEIAKELGLDGSTVRSRLARALDRLRLDLDRDHHGCERWLSALVVVAPPTRDAAIGSILTLLGGTLMTKTKFVLSACLALAMFALS